MTFPSIRLLAGFLRVGVLMPGLLAMVVGILGMHILAASHGIEGSPVTAPHGFAGLHQTAPHGKPASHAVSLENHGTGIAETGDGLCQAGSPCKDMTSLHPACIPSLGHGSLSAPLPDAINFEPRQGFDLAGRAHSYPYTPRSLSPGELCISRT